MKFKNKKQKEMEVIAATSFDERFDAQNVVDPDLSKFWVTTGLFPQELVIEARGGANLGEVRMVTTNVRLVQIELCKNEGASDFAKAGEKEVDHNYGGHQNFAVPIKDGNGTRFIKVILAAGYDDFASVHKIDF